MSKNTATIKSVTPTLCKLFGCRTPEHCFTNPVDEVCQSALHTFKSSSAQKALVCIPDGFGNQLKKKSLSLFKALGKLSQCEVSMLPESPSYCSVCNASLLSGVSPYTHGIIAKKPEMVLIDTLFEACHQTNLKCCLITEPGSSFQAMFHHKPLSIICEEKYQITGHANELIQSNEYDLIVVHWPQYHLAQKASNTLDPVALEQAQYIVSSYLKLLEQTSISWAQSNRVIAFTPNHGGEDSTANQITDFEEQGQSYAELTHFWSLHHGKSNETQ